MKMHEFSIIASGLDPQSEDFETRFFNAGCDDATISFQKGHIIADFAREAETFDEAMSSAIKAVKKTGATVDRVEPDPLVSLSEIAIRAGISRAAVTNYFKERRKKEFPAPVAKVTTKSPLWDWATVARWMFENGQLDLATALDAEIVKQANEAISDGKSDIDAQLRKRAKEYQAELQAA